MAFHLNHSDVPLQGLRHSQSSATKYEKLQAGPVVNDVERSDKGKEEIQWRPGFKSQFPWLGFGALATMLVCVALTIVILTTSNQKAQEVWPAYQKWEWIKASWRQKAHLTPSTALAAVNTVTNLALTIAIGNGVAIAWWRKALNGATVAELHNSWAYSTSTLDLLTAGRGFNLIALCALTAKLALVDNVLLQQAAATKSDQFKQSVTHIQLPIVKELPADFAGVWSSDGSTGYLTEAFSYNLYNYFSSSQSVSFDELWDTSTMDRRFDTKCVGRCEFDVEGFGVNVTCSQGTTSEYEVTPESVTQAKHLANNDERSFNESGATSILTSTFFIPHIVDGNDTGYPEPWIEMDVDYAQITSNETNYNDGDSLAQTCQGTLYSRTCSIRPAIVKYHVIITNESGVTEDMMIMQDLTLNWHNADTSDIDPLQNGQVLETQVTAPAYQTDPSKFNNVMLSLYNFLYGSFRTSISIQYLNGTGFAAHGDMGIISQWWAQSVSSNQMPSSCEVSVTDPTAWLVTQLNSVLFRASISAAVNQNWTSPEYKQAISSSIVRNIAGNQTINTVIYHSEYAYLGAAIGVTVLCILCVLPTYWGFWELGRKVTMGPVEIASAFQAPALSSTLATGAEVDKLLEEVGHREVRYGIVGPGKLAMAEASETVRLRPGAPLNRPGELMSR